MPASDDQTTGRYSVVALRSDGDRSRVVQFGWQLNVASVNLFRFVSHGASTVHVGDSLAPVATHLNEPGGAARQGTERGHKRIPFGRRTADDMASETCNVIPDSPVRNNQNVSCHWLSLVRRSRLCVQDILTHPVEGRTEKATRLVVTGREGASVAPHAFLAAALRSPQPMRCPCIRNMLRGSVRTRSQRGGLTCQSPRSQRSARRRRRASRMHQPGNRQGRQDDSEHPQRMDQGTAGAVRRWKDYGVSGEPVDHVRAGRIERRGRS